MNYTNNIPVLTHGIDVDRICFSGGRVAASMMKHGGLARIEYFGHHRMGYQQFFDTDPMSAWWQLFRLLIVVDGNTYYGDCKIGGSKVSESKVPPELLAIIP